MKYEFKGTKGEWIVGRKDNSGDGVEGYLIDSPSELNNTFIAAAFIDEEHDALANAHLIAAAPELLDACIEAYNELNHLIVIDDTDTGKKLKQGIHKALNLKP